MHLTKIKRTLSGKKIDKQKYLSIARNAKIVWHPLTPHNFQCEGGCVCCCGPTFYFDSELGHLPGNILNNLVEDSETGTIHPEFSEGCCFHTKLQKIGCTDYGCLINGFEPLRCKLFPFWPVIVKDKIIIMAEDILDVFTRDAPNPYYRCFGLGKGPDITEKIEKLSREFIIKIIQERTGFLPGNVFTNLKDIIDPVRAEMHRHPLVNTYTEALPHLLTSQII